MFSPATVHISVIIKQYQCDFHTAIVSRAWSQYVLSNMPPKRVAASKKKECVRTDDQAELLLTRAERTESDQFLLPVTRWPINHVTIS